MSLLSTATATGGYPRVPPPTLFIDMFQSGDAGHFLIEVFDPTSDSDKPICSSRIPPADMAAHYMQAARVLDNNKNLAEAMLAGAEWKKTPRYQDMVRYGRKLYTDLFGTTDVFSRYVKRAKHLQNGFQFVLRLFNAASELWSIPWEYAHDGEMFLVTERGWPMTRILRDVRAENPQLTATLLPKPLNVLVILSGDGSTSPDDEMASMNATFKEAEERGLIAVDYVEDASVRDVELALAEHDYQIVHYIGRTLPHSAGGALAMQDDDGAPRAASARDLLPILRNEAGLRVLMMNGSKGQAEDVEAASGLAAGLVGVVPAIISMQFPMSVSGSRAFALAFYGALTQGVTVEDSVHAGRLAMLRASEQKLDWGAPAVFVQRSGIRVIDPRANPAPRRIHPDLLLEPLPTPKVFVGRRDALRVMRSHLTTLTAGSIFIWGLPGIGKSALARRLAERPGRSGLVVDVLAVDCASNSPRDLLERLTGWLEYHFPKTGEIMRNGLLPADVRIAEAAQHVRGRRLILILDGFDTVLTPGEDNIGTVSNKALHDFFTVLASANWSVLTIFTSRRYWSALPELKRTVVLPLYELSPDETGTLISQMEHLRRVPPAGRKVLLDNIGGHVGTLHLIENAVARDPSRAAKIDAAFVRSLLARLEGDWIAEVLNGLNTTEISVLTAASFFNPAFWAAHVRYIARLPNNTAAEALMVRWETRGVSRYMFDDEDREPWYSVPVIIRATLNTRLSEPGRLAIHRGVAETIQFTLYHVAQQLAVRQVAIDVDQDDPFETAIQALRYQLAHAPDGVRQHIVETALDWRTHWLAADQPENARAIVAAIWRDIAFSLGKVDLAESLLIEAVKSAKGREGLLMRADLADLNAIKGKTDEAFEQFGMLAAAFAKAGDGAHHADMLSAQGRIVADKNIRRAIALETEALNIRLKLGKPETVARTYRTLTRYKLAQQDINGATKMVEEAVTFAERSRHKSAVAAAMLARGSLLIQMQDYREASRMLEQSIQLAQEQGEMEMLADAYTEIAEIHRLGKNYDVSAHFLTDAMEIGQRLGDWSSVTVRAFRLAQTYAALRAFGDAAVTAEYALDHARRHRPDMIADIQTFLQRVNRAR